MTRRAIPRSTSGDARNVALALGELVADAPRETLLFGTGSIPLDLGGTQRASLLTAAQYRKLSEKVQDRFDLRDISGTDVSGNNSSRAALQKGFDQAFADGVALCIPTGKLVADSTITVTNGVTVLGDSTGLGRAVAGYTEGAATGPASRIHFSHSGKGIRFVGTPTVYDGVLLCDLMFTRDQPAIGAGTWEPNDHDYDLEMFGMAGLNLQNILMLNPTRAINMAGGGNIGRLFTDNLMGQPLKVGVNVELAADVVRMTNTHFWPVWRDHIKVNGWTIDNCDHVWLKRCDTPMFTSFFSIASRSAFRISRRTDMSPPNTVTKMKVSNYDIDYSKYCIWFDGDSQNAWARFDNGTLQANNSNGSLANIPASTNRQNLRMDGASCHAMFNGLEISGASGSAMTLGIDGKNNYVEVAGDFWVQNYGEAVGNTDPCIQAGSGSTFVRHGMVKNTSTATGDLVGGAGRFVGIRKAYAPGITAQSGTYATTSLTDAEFIEEGYTVTGTVNVAVSNAGAATGYMDVTLPTELDISFGLSASDITDGTILRAVVVPGNPAKARISKPGGGNVGVTGHTINLTFSYVRKAD